MYEEHEHKACYCRECRSLGREASPVITMDVRPVDTAGEASDEARLLLERVTLMSV